MRRQLLTLLVLATAVVVAAPVAGQATRPARPEFIRSDSAAPYSQAVRAGGMIYLSGMLGTEGGGLVPGGIQPETRRILENVKRTLEQLGSSMKDVVKCTVFLADTNDWAAMNQVWIAYFPENRPARSAVGAGKLLLDARVEIECIAAAGRRSVR